MENAVTPRRDGQRIDLRLRVRYSADESRGEAEASDVSPHGLRLESDRALPLGARLQLHVDAGDGPPTPVTAQVMWCREHLSPTGKVMQRAVCQFLNLPSSMMNMIQRYILKAQRDRIARGV